MNKYNNTQQACGSWMQFSKNSRFTCLFLLFMLRGPSCFQLELLQKNMSSLDLTAPGNFCFFSEEKKVMVCLFFF